MNGEDQRSVSIIEPRRKSSMMNESETKDTKLDNSNSRFSKPNNKGQHVDSVTLIEDQYAQYYDEGGKQHSIKRFTWKNKNKIEVQVINYGARVISIKLPDRKGEVEDVLLGFDDLAGYLFYDKYYFGSIIGRVSNVVKNSTLSVGDHKVSISTNHGKHSIHGGFKGLDKMVWDTFIEDKKVIMSHISPHNSEGYPGDLLVRATFELSPKNEFTVSFDAQTTRPTCIDLSHLLYFNLAGHCKGPAEIYRHILTLNCNCFTPQVDGIPTGEVLNVIHSSFDFQVPKCLGKVIGVEPKDGFDQNLCVNRGMYQGECFVGRILHPPTGRMMEIYSNQPGVQLKTADNFGYGIIRSNGWLVKSRNQHASKEEGVSVENTMCLFEKVHEKLVDLLKVDGQQNFEEIKELISKFSMLKSKGNKDISNSITENGLILTPLQLEYLTKANEITCDNEETDDECVDLKEVLTDILSMVQVVEQPKVTPEILIKKIDESLMDERKPSVTIPKEASTLSTEHTSNRDNRKIRKNNLNFIPVHYKNSDQIRGKGRALYEAHGAIALQTQNYPNAVNIKSFPNANLYPGEVYKHEIVYRFWIRAGNPNKWIRRNQDDIKEKLIK